jgi:hypothetical protein
MPWFVADLLSSYADCTYAQTVDMKELVRALQQGGYVLVFRHGATSRDQADTDPLNYDNVAQQRLPSEQGRTVARQVSGAFEMLLIPLGKVYTSKFNRAVETGRRLSSGEVMPSVDITEGGAVGLIATGFVWLVHQCASVRAGSAADASAPTTDTSVEINALKADVEHRKAMVPDQAHAMKDVAYHFANLWVAAQAEVHTNIREQSSEEFPTSSQHALESCYSCHVAAGKPFLRLQIPQRPEAAIIRFAPEPL